ncbi:MAG TPA: hypothetical protein VKQ72_04920, partial [Aggregatilineales bacterium]|nr:hypothetical protein [Aggregatilineales bacterium]
MKHRVVFSLLLALYVSLNAGLFPVQAQPLQNAACPKAAPARLAVGSKGQVIAPSSKALTYPTAFLKPDTTHTSSVLRYLPVGTVVDVTGGAQCGDDGNRWWKVKLGDLTGYIEEAIGKDYVLAPAQNGETGASPLPTTTMVALVCIAPRTTPTKTTIQSAAASPTQTLAFTATPSVAATVAATVSSKITPTVTPTLTLTPTPEVSPTATLDPSKSVSRVAYATSDGAVYVSDNGGAGRTLNRFDPPPLSVDLSPDGTAVLVANYNGLYWIDATNGNTVLVDDPLKFGLAEEAWIDRVSWLPDGLRAAVETTKIDTGTLVFSLWEAPLDGSAFPYEVDTGAQYSSQFVSGIQRSPSGQKSVLLSTNNIGRWPT